MSLSLKNLGAITFFVEDLARTKTFYQDRLGLKLIMEDATSVLFDFGNTVLNFITWDGAPELVAPAPVAKPGSGAQLQFTIWVEDTNAVIADLVVNGIPLLNGPFDRPWGVRTACFADPDGYVWEVAQQIG